MNQVYLFLYLLSAVYAEYHLDSNNKFQEILIFINDNVKEGNGDLLHRIMNHVTNASKSLWKATSHMNENKAGVQFGTVHIRIPETWNIQANPITWEQCNTALFFVTIDNIDKNEKPITKQLGKCGEPGNFTRLPVSFFKATSQNETFKRGKEFMKEFVKLRYGVYSEEPVRNQLLVFNGTNLVNGVCGKDIKWSIVKDKYQCQEPNTKCRYEIIKNQHHNHSIMFDSETYTSEYFCDDKYRVHNKYAKNLHNRKCKQKSVTSVILSHKDFETNKRPTILENVKFHFVKGQNRKIVLVLDTSGSMKLIIANMRLATVAFLDSLESTAIVGIVRFDSVAVILSYPIVIGDSNNKRTLINIIESLRDNGGTNIPDGLAKGVQVLGGNIANDDNVHGSIILLTDGENTQNYPYKYDYVINQLIKKKIPVNAIAYGNQADSSLNRITTGTNGKYLYANPNTQYTDLLEKFSAKHSCEISIDQEIKSIDEKININLFQKVQILNLTYIDKYIGVNLKLTLTIPKDKENYNIILIDPKKQRFSLVNKVKQESGITISFFIPGTPVAGMYAVEFQSPTYKRYKRNTDSFSITLTVSGKSIQNNERTISPSGDLSASSIEDLNENSSISAHIDLTTCGILAYENIKVLLFIDRPVKDTKIVEMLDDGIGDDSIENDKVFTKILYAKDLEDPGFYSFMGHIQINNTLTGEIIKRTIVLGSLRVNRNQIKKLEDKIPPSKIENIRLQSVPNQNILNVFLTATGNDGMIGNISDYEFQIKSKIILIEKHKANTFPREMTEFELNLTNKNITNPFEVSVRGIDDNKNIGEWSDPIPYNWKYKEILKANFPKNQNVKHVVSFKLLFCSFTLLTTVHKIMF